MITKNGKYKGGKVKNMAGLRFGRLQVIDEAGKLSHNEMFWNCVCDCGKSVVVRGSSLRNGMTQSCGCLHKEAFAKYRRTNEYAIDGDIVRVKLDNKNAEMICDIDDWERLKQYRWRLGNNGYAETSSINGVVTPYHHFVIDCPPGMYRDHINRNRLDNRKTNLRILNPFESVLNRGLSKNNISGYRGVTYSKRYKKWVAQITYQRKNHVLGRFENIEDAIEARKQGEIEYFGKVVSDYGNPRACQTSC